MLLIGDPYAKVEDEGDGEWELKIVLVLDRGHVKKENSVIIYSSSCREKIFPLLNMTEDILKNVGTLQKN